MRQTKIVDIAGTKYEIRQVNARVASHIVLRLGKLLDGANLANLDISKAVDKLVGGDSDFILDALAAETKVKQLLTTGATIDTALDWPEQFAGDLMALGLWAKAALEVNFASFFTGLGTLANANGLLAKLTGFSNSPIGSTGTSGVPS